MTTIEAQPLKPKRPWITRERVKQQPVPLTRADAEHLYRPASRITRATGARLHRLNALGLLELRTEPGTAITQGEAHAAILDALYDPITGALRVDEQAIEQPVRAQPVHETGD